jgi:hypothetical protein
MKGFKHNVFSRKGPGYRKRSPVLQELLLASEYVFTHVTSSPYHAQSNGETERAVKTVKGLLKKNKDPYRALLAYRFISLHHGSSPARAPALLIACLSGSA